MKFGVLRNIAGNIEALTDADKRFDQFGVDVKVCIGGIVGLYPYVDECVEFLTDRGYLALRTQHDDGFVSYCDGTGDFRGWSTSHLVEVLEFARNEVSTQSVGFLRELPQRREINGVAFEGLAPGGCYLNRPKDVEDAFANWKHLSVIHAAFSDPYVWYEDLTGSSFSTGQNILKTFGRLLISTGGVGSKYNGSLNTRQPAAIIFDDKERTVHLLRPMCNLKKIVSRLRETDYPRGPLKYLETMEYEAWRK